MSIKREQERLVKSEQTLDKAGWNAAKRSLAEDKYTYRVREGMNQMYWPIKPIIHRRQKRQNWKTTIPVSYDISNQAQSLPKWNKTTTLYVYRTLVMDRMKALAGYLSA